MAREILAMGERRCGGKVSWRYSIQGSSIHDEIIIQGIAALRMTGEGKR